VSSDKCSRLLWWESSKENNMLEHYNEKLTSQVNCLTWSESIPSYHFLLNFSSNKGTSPRVLPPSHVETGKVHSPVGITIGLVRSAPLKLNLEQRSFRCIKPWDAGLAGGSEEDCKLEQVCAWYGNTHISVVVEKVFNGLECEDSLDKVIVFRHRQHKGVI